MSTRVRQEERGVDGEGAAVVVAVALDALEAGLAGHHFVRRADGSLYVAPVWPGPAVFPDFTQTASRDWWGSLYKDFIADAEKYLKHFWQAGTLSG